MTLCEIRIPTYRRPHLLRRALSSVAAQTERHLRCIVFDDSPAREAEAVVAEFPELDIAYHANPENLGISRNLGQCFRTRAFERAEYAFCLEDDNMIAPTFVAENVALLRQTGAAIAVTNQQIQTADGSISAALTTYSGGFKDGVYNARFALLATVCYTGLTNGSLFWSTSANSELCIGLDCPDPIFQELFRPYAFQDVWVFSSRPLSVFNDELAVSFRRRQARLAEWMLVRWRFLGVLRARRHAISLLDAENLWPRALESLSRSRMEQAERCAAWARRPLAFDRLTKWSILRRYVGGLAASAFRGPNLGPSFERLLASKTFDEKDQLTVASQAPC